MLKGLQLSVVIVDDFVLTLDFLETHRIIVTVRQTSLELGLEVVDLLCEVIQLLLDLDTLLHDQGQDILLDFVDFLVSFVEVSVSSVDALDRVLFTLLHNGNGVLLKFHDHALHAFQHGINLALHVLHLRNVLHDVHQELAILFLLFFSEFLSVLLHHHVLWIDLQPVVGSRGEFLQVLESSLELVNQEVRVNFDPNAHTHLECFDKVAQINFEPILLNGADDLGDVGLDLPQLRDLLVEQFHIWDLLSAALKQQVSTLDRLLALDFFILGLVVGEEFLKGLFWIDLP